MVLTTAMRAATAPLVGKLQTAAPARIQSALRKPNAVVKAAAVETMPGFDPLDKMFCYQCEQTAHNTGCTTVGVCGKDSDLSALMDLLVYDLKGLATWAAHARKVGGIDTHPADSFIMASLFATMTNVNFDDERFKGYLLKSAELRRDLKQALGSNPGPEVPTSEQVPWLGTDMMPHPVEFDVFEKLGNDPKLADLLDLGAQVGIVQRLTVMGNRTLVGLQELLLYGLKGMCAYAHHAEQIGYKDESVYAFVDDAMAFLCSPAAADGNAVLEWCLKCGECNYRVMDLLDRAHNETYGVATPTEVSLTPRPGKCILISGHDIRDTYELLQQTEGTGINVYTHGELLPAHGYPKLRAFQHLAGNIGGAWYQQKKDFDRFPGAILMTTNCVVEPLTSYQQNLFTTGEVGVSSGNHIGGGHPKDFSPLIKRALEMPGFSEAEIPKEKKTVHVGFNHRTVMGIADQVLAAIEQGKLKHVFVIGGCDGHEPQRAYYANVGKTMPQDTAVLTMGCGKFRIYDQDFGNIPGTQLPRLMDVGQCNDAFSAVAIAIGLSKALNCGVNDLPLSLDISWFEQKAVAVLLTLLHLGVKNIRLGPRLPAFLTPEAVQLLVDTYNLMPADTAHPADDLKKMMARA